MPMNRIRELRKEMGWNQKELGEELKVGQTTISAWETMRNEPDTISQSKMAKLFGCSIGYLMGYEENNGYRGLTAKEYETYCQKIREKEEQKKLEGNEVDPEEQEIIKAHEQNETCETWEKAQKQIYIETAEIERIFEENNLTEEERKNAVEIIKTAIKFKK